MLETQQIKEILKKETHSIGSVFKTIKYVYKSKSHQNVKELLSKNFNKNPTLLVSLVWELSKYFVIANELIESRENIFYMIFSKYADTFSQKELLKILNNPSNQWLDLHHEKIQLLQFFCDELFKKPNICKEICEVSNISPSEYHALITGFLNIFDDVKYKAFDNYKENKKRKLLEERNRFFIEDILPSNEYEKRIELYDKNFEDTTLLEIK